MDITSWSQLTLDEKNSIIKILASIFTTIGTSAATAESWYNSGFLRLSREVDRCIIKGLDNPDIKDYYVELATVMN